MTADNSTRIFAGSRLTLISTERLLLRPFTPADLARTHELFDTHPDVWRFDGRYPRSLEQRRDLLQWRIFDFEHEGFGAMAIVLRATGEVIGQSGLQYWLCEREDGAQPEVELFYKLGHEFWGSGYATEAGRALIEYAFTRLKLRRIVSTAIGENAHSIALMRRLGMTVHEDAVNPEMVLGTLERVGGA
ncbi:MAG: GNAT family N-acetyltransferase [Ktedonobacterales bacterium]